MSLRSRSPLLLAGLALLMSLPTSAATVESPRRIVAVGDVHGTPSAFRSILESAGVIDAAGDWAGEDVVLVQTGDFTDRGTEVKEVMDFLRHLEDSAAENGSEIVSLLGNHEIYNLVGFFDYQSTPLAAFTEIAADFVDDLSEKRRKQAYKKWSAWARRYRGCGGGTRTEWMARHPPGFIEYQEALSPRGDYGKWLRAKKVVAEVDGTLFLHGGLSVDLVEEGLASLEQINRAAAAELAQFDDDRSYLEREGVALTFSTLGEIYCAMAHEVQAAPPGSLPTDKVVRKRQLQEINERLPNSESWMTLDETGPLWFRGYASWTDEEAEEALATVFGTYGGSRVVVGHTPQWGNIVSRFDGRVFLIDTGMAYADITDGRAAALEILGDRVAAIYEGERVQLLPAPEPAPAPVAGEREPAEAGAPAVAGWGQEKVEALLDGAAESAPAAEGRWLGADGRPLPFADDEALLDFLTHAEVLESKEIGQGVTKPKQLLLERDGVRARAVYHDVRVSRMRHRLATGEMVLYFQDSYQNNKAAYELARMMGITNVPPAVIRNVNGRQGSVQLWIENTFDETTRRRRGAEEPLPIAVRRRTADMWVFDNLINNIDRNQGNMLYDGAGGFWWIDHTRTFARADKLPSPDRVRRCSRSLLAALRALDRSAVDERLDELLDKFEIRSLFRRRDKLVELLEEKIASRGEDRVLFTYGDADDSVRVSYGEPDDIPASPDAER